MPRSRSLAWKQNRITPWLLGLLAVLVAVLHTRPEAVQGLQNWFYDQAISSARRDSPAEVALVTIDEASQARYGRLPWSRDLHARMIERLNYASVVVDTEPFVGHESERALAELQNIHATVAADPVLAKHPELPALLARSEASLDGDARLTNAIEHHQRVLLSLAPLPHDEPAATASRSATRPSTPAPGTPLSAPWPLSGLRDVAAGIGHNELGTDKDNVLRRHPLQVQVGTYRVSSLAVLAVGMYRGMTPAQVEEALQAQPPRLGKRNLPVDPQRRIAPVWTTASTPHHPVLTVSAQDLLDNKATAERLQGLIVIIGRDDPATARYVQLPDGRVVTPAEALARTTAALVSAQWVEQPLWATAVPWLLWALALAYLLWLLPTLALASAAMVTLIGALALTVLSLGLLNQLHVWVPPTLPMLTLLLGHGVFWLLKRVPWLNAPPVSAKPSNKHRSSSSRRSKTRPARLDPTERDTVVTGLDEMPEPLNAAVATAMDSRAALQQEGRASRFPAQAHIPAHLPTHLTSPPTRALAEDPTHDNTVLDSTLLDAYAPTQPIDRSELIVDPLERAAAMRALEDTLPLPRHDLPPAPQVTEPPRPVSDGLQRLSHYQLDAELGRGAMGRIYLAHDVRTGQEVAIKTLALAREFAGYALKEARQRFQREALAASRLSHPDIVAILDSGEEQGVAYIVMERLTGHDLTQHLRAGSLLPVATIMSICARVSAALAHAHAQGVVHRDIKPANVMIDLARGQVKVTDFGIARISDASQTRTGLVLGSPSYMSPEQLAGRPVDGRSDLYSLGVLMFHLLTGELPINGHTMADLIQAIGNTPAPDIRAIRPALPESVANVVGILLEKYPELRYRDGLELSADLKLIASMLQRGKLNRVPVSAASEASSVEEYAPEPPASPSKSPETETDGAQSNAEPWTARVSPP